MSPDRSRIEGLVPFVHVRDIVRSTAFYERLGFELRNTYEVDGRRVWCWLERNRARLMLAEAGEPVVAAEQAVLFWAYVHDFDELRDRLAAGGCDPGPVAAGPPGPDRQFGVSDPDGYLVMVADAAAMTPPPAS